MLKMEMGNNVRGVRLAENVDARGGEKREEEKEEKAELFKPSHQSFGAMSIPVVLKTRVNVDHAGPSVPLHQLKVH